MRVILIDRRIAIRDVEGSRRGWNMQQTRVINNAFKALKFRTGLVESDSNCRSHAAAKLK